VGLTHQDTLNGHQGTARRSSDADLRLAIRADVTEGTYLSMQQLSSLLTNAASDEIVVNDYYDNLQQELERQASSFSQGSGGSSSDINANGKRPREDEDGGGRPGASDDPESNPIVQGICSNLIPFLLSFHRLTRFFVVNGKPMRYLDVKEVHHDMMTPEEYTDFIALSEKLGFL
jgi:hypothetical protein